MGEDGGLISGVLSACAPWKGVELEDARSWGSAVFCVRQIVGCWLYTDAENAFVNKEAKSFTWFDLFSR